MSQPLFELLKCQCQRTATARFKGKTVELITPSGSIDADPARGDDLHPLFETKFESLVVAFEHDAGDGGVGIFEAKVEVPRSVVGDARDFADDAKVQVVGL